MWLVETNYIKPKDAVRSQASIVSHMRLVKTNSWSKESKKRKIALEGGMYDAAYIGRNRRGKHY